MISRKGQPSFAHITGPGCGPVPAAREIDPGKEARTADYKKSDPFYHTKEWKRIRVQALQRDGGMCQDCMERMRSGIAVRPHRATMVHHIIPRTERPDLALVLENLRSLCAKCHERNHPEKWSKPKRKTEGRKTGHRMTVVKV